MSCPPPLIFSPPGFEPPYLSPASLFCRGDNLFGVSILTVIAINIYFILFFWGVAGREELGRIQRRALHGRSQSIQFSSLWEKKNKGGGLWLLV